MFVPLLNCELSSAITNIFTNITDYYYNGTLVNSLTQLEKNNMYCNKKYMIVYNSFKKIVLLDLVHNLNMPILLSKNNCNFQEDKYLLSIIYYFSVY